MTQAARKIVVIPVKDEAERLQSCLTALARQTNAAFDEILVFVNNSSDGSSAIARAIAGGSAIPVLVADVALPAGHAHAVGARQQAMEWAAARAGDDGILFTTDADGAVAPDWLDVNLAALESGAEVVAGRALLDSIDEARLPLSLLKADAQECHFAALLDEIDALLDPNPDDPWPRHDEHSGASIAVTVSAFRRAGGIPLIECGEDRAFFAELRRVDARIRHRCDATVTVSGRTEGRATGGMADTIRRRMICADAFLDSRLEPAHLAIARARSRRRVREYLLKANDDSADELMTLAAALDVDADIIRSSIGCPYFGAAWMTLEKRSPRLRHQPVPVTAVNEQIAIAQNFLAAVGGSDALSEQSA